MKFCSLKIPGAKENDKICLHFIRNLKIKLGDNRKTMVEKSILES